MFGIKTATKKKKTFNLLYVRGRQLDGWEKIYVWLSGTCRIIIIVTLLIIIVSFGFRFVNERELNDLKESSESLSFRLKSYEKRQKDITALQTEMSAYNKAWKPLSNYSKILDDLIALNPQGITNFNIGLTLTGISISGSGSRDAVSNAEIAYKNSPLLINVTLNSLSSKSASSGSSGGIFTFDITGDFSEKLIRGDLITVSKNAK